MLILTRADVEQLIDIEGIITAVATAHAALAEGRATQTVELATRMSDDGALLLPMAAALGAEDGDGSGVESAAVAGVKLLTDVPANALRGLGVQHSTITVVDPETGLCRALLDGLEITRQRTAAASAVATRLLARPDAHTLGLIGTGNLAHTHVRAIRAVRDIDRVVIWGRTRANAERFVTDSGELDLDITIADSPEEVVGEVDVLCTLTPSRLPIVRGEWFRPGLHVNAVGAPPRPDHREVDTEGIRRSRVVVDDLAAATSRSGEICVPLSSGEFSAEHIVAELGDLVLGTRPGRLSEGDITLFNSVGLAIQDFAAARHVLALAEARGVGTSIDLHLSLSDTGESAPEPSSYTNA